MYLKSLEILGFKSFAAKTVLTFDRGVTVIVGPNGCGKSNVLDSVRWVLGEQSAKALRGGEMADVIFSGTDSRPALGMAEVSMTFADCEKDLGVAWNEVTITRRVYRDGQGEYFLNKTPCRLRDIHQLFMDTGVGRSAYSIMEQGKIDQILSSRPEERRAIFEEAAGITKFKAQRREALRKLEATEANLLRLTDVIREVKRQIGSLQRQAAKARRYQAILGNLRTLDTHNSQRLYRELENERCAVAEKNTRLQSTQEQRDQDVRDKEQAVAERRRGLELLEEQLTQARQTVNELHNRVTQGESRIGFNNERQAECRALVDRYEADIAASDERLSVAQEQIEQADQELETLKETLAAQEAQLQERQSSAGDLTAQRVELERQQQAVFAQISQAESRLAELRTEIAACVNARDGAQARLAIMGEEIESLRNAGEALQIQENEATAQIEQAAADLEARKAEAAEAETLVRNAQAELSLLDKDLNAESRRLAERESRLDVLRQLNADGEGFSEGTQAVLKGLDNPSFYKPAILGALAQFLEVGAAHIIPIEAALGQNLQAIVMKDTLVAEAVMKTLSTKKLGRASLALRPLWDATTPHTDAPSTLPPGALGWANDKVKCQADVEPLVRQLLAGVVLVENLETALRLAASGPVGQLSLDTTLRCTFVTLAGEIVTREGIVLGGQSKEEGGSSVLRRKAQITELETEAAAIRNALAEMTLRRHDAAARFEASQQRQQEARDEAQTLTLTLQHLHGRIDTLGREAGETRRKLDSYGAERDAIERRHDEALERLARLEEDAQTASSEITAQQARQGELQNGLAGLRENESLFTSELNELRVRAATERERYLSLQNQRQPMHARMAELRELIEQRRRDIDAYTAKAAQLAEDSENVRAGITQAESRLGEAEESVKCLLAERSETAIQVEAQEAALRETRLEVSQSHETRTQLEVRASQLALRIEALAERVLHRYQLDIREFQSDSYTFTTTLRELKKKQKSVPGDDEPDAPESAEPAPETAEADADDAPQGSADGPDWDLVERFIKELDTKIEAMGPVNVEAIQEYDELEERYKFLEQQNTDLEKSKSELLEVIAKINHTTKTLFADTFEQVRVNFKEMFRELFGGGQANLVLLDESDPLESGIDIIAKPPGKQLTSISLLSGGEKTMTAVSLLFAIYMVKPSPFGILDEMDAPLDESNINRFIKILDRFVSQSQFVVISHNKRTIAKGDIIYGVTMEEHGVSKLVSVKFTKREDSAQNNDVIGTANAVPSVAESFGKSGDLQSEREAAAQAADASEGLPA
ncbi:MAG: chromosome segregation protein SMC [Chthoniobacteraceae bacterium]|nr:chromosome segregation protein SMC [Chthoniobacteraceae bacterium]